MVARSRHTNGIDKFQFIYYGLDRAIYISIFPYASHYVLRVVAGNEGEAAYSLLLL